MNSKLDPIKVGWFEQFETKNIKASICHSRSKTWPKIYLRILFFIFSFTLVHCCCIKYHSQSLFFPRVFDEISRTLLLREINYLRGAFMETNHSMCDIHKWHLIFMLFTWNVSARVGRKSKEKGSPKEELLSRHEFHLRKKWVFNDTSYFINLHSKRVISDPNVR